MENGYVCLKCDSRMIITDYETIPGMTGRHPYRKCFKCGSRQTKEQEDEVGTYGKKCEASGCEKKSWLKGLRHKHYIEKHGEYIPENPSDKVIQQIETTAVKEFRTFALQVAYYLHKGMQA